MSASEDRDITPTDEPIELFRAWFAEAVAHEPNDPDAMSVATVDSSGLPDVRMVLLKGVDTRGFVFYTNLESAKGEELARNPQAALCFHWKSLGRQVRVRGPVVAVSQEEADAYFATRPKDSQIGAWASRQSRPLEGRFALEKEVARFAAKYALTSVPRPAHWSGFRVQPLHIEFWRARAFRLHERLRYSRDSLDSPWVTERLFP
uniref:Pyridoxamine 5'-phosphate oxidase n=1 Tax=uncultured bacterium 12AC_lac13 TaxID=1447233 RepID=X2LBF5_9BACT|nr:pyridoxamine 5'-phosphate oxidase [uncultured bacterium 12AC_lac13]